MEDIAKVIYSWALNNREAHYKEIFSNMNGGGNGLTYALYCLLAVTALAVLLYYFVVAANATNATKKNFLITMLVGLFVLLVANFLVIGILSGYTGDLFASSNMWRLTALDVLYFLILSEVLCWFVKGISRNAKYIDWLALIKN